MRNADLFGQVRGEKVRFVIAPFTRGEGNIVGCYVREVVTYTFDERYGDIEHAMDLFDVEIQVSEGFEFGAVSCSAAVAVVETDLTGQNIVMHKLSRLELLNAVTNGDVLQRTSVA
ncbi:hypothetical protein K7H13_13845 [Qipengyuania citrea]|uniref:hypothetical protein n=1 Tax=Qipengyuania citrea TaxID=225971 RepID=UPI001E3E3D0D|nr:hypothetical protein [Qipengyuania citrea]MCD1591832.1 hypothetical protein [Qipengyuania citrea]